MQQQVLQIQYILYLDYDSYYDYFNNTITTKVISVGDNIQFYKNGIIDASNLHWQC